MNDQQTKNGPTMKFLLGRLATTRKALEAVPQDDIIASLTRHAAGDWGDIDEEDWAANNDAVKDGGRLLSVYRSRDGRTFWIITEADRSATTVLLPEEY